MIILNTIQETSDSIDSLFSRTDGLDKFTKAAVSVINIIGTALGSLPLPAVSFVQFGKAYNSCFGAVKWLKETGELIKNRVEATAEKIVKFVSTLLLAVAEITLFVQFLNQVQVINFANIASSIASVPVLGLITYLPFNLVRDGLFFSALTLGLIHTIGFELPKVRKAKDDFKDIKGDIAIQESYITALEDETEDNIFFDAQAWLRREKAANPDNRDSDLDLLKSGLSVKQSELSKRKFVQAKNEIEERKTWFKIAALVSKVALVTFSILATVFGFICFPALIVGGSLALTAATIALVKYIHDDKSDKWLKKEEDRVKEEFEAIGRVYA